AVVPPGGGAHRHHRVHAAQQPAVPYGHGPAHREPHHRHPPVADHPGVPHRRVHVEDLQVAHGGAALGAAMAAEVEPDHAAESAQHVSDAPGGALTPAAGEAVGE